MVRKYRRLGGNLLGTARLALPLPAPRRLFHFDLDQLLTLLVLNFAADILCDYLKVGQNAQFWIWGWASASTGYLMTLVACYVVAKMARAPAVALALTILALAGGLILDVPVTIATLLWGGGNTVAGWAFWHLSLLVFTLWYALIGFRALRLLLPRRSWPVALLGLFVVLGPLAPTVFGIVVPFWYVPPSHAAEDDGPPLDVEQTYYAQPGLIRAALDGVAPYRPGETSLYFIGFASWADQDVFLKEARFARHLFDQKFGTEGRSLLLVNNPATVAELPLASVSNLGLALDGVAAKMDRDRDVLFLFLTSHGSRGEVAVRFDRFELNGLTADGLREALDHAGIKWRIIVISACYSGSFVNTLADSSSVIMTAASKDRTSFGCSNENDFTYFGEAYFSQALQGTRSFLDAFDQAKASIAEREKAEKLTASEPQIFIGQAIRPKLAEIQAQLDRQVAPGPGAP